MIKENFSDKIIIEQRPEGSEGVVQADIFYLGVECLAEGTAIAKYLKWEHSSCIHWTTAKQVC